MSQYGVQLQFSCNCGGQDPDYHCWSADLTLVSPTGQTLVLHGCLCQKGGTDGPCGNGNFFFCTSAGSIPGDFDPDYWLIQLDGGDGLPDSIFPARPCQPAMSGTGFLWGPSQPYLLAVPGDPPIPAPPGGQ